MSKRANTTIIEAMLAASGLHPNWDDDYFENNISWLDVPSDGVEKALWLIEDQSKTKK